MFEKFLILGVLEHLNVIFWPIVQASSVSLHVSLVISSNKPLDQNLSSNIMENDYVCMSKIVERKRSCKKAARRLSVRSAKVKRQKSLKRKSSTYDKSRKIKRTVSAKRTKSFIVKRKSFKRPRRWSTYIKEDEKYKQKQTKAGTLPRIKGIWEARKYKDLTLKRQQWRAVKENNGTVTR